MQIIFWRTFFEIRYHQEEGIDNFIFLIDKLMSFFTKKNVNEINPDTYFGALFFSVCFPTEESGSNVFFVFGGAKCGPGKDFD
jgi:hypothetical protein